MGCGTKNGEADESEADLEAEAPNGPVAWQWNLRTLFLLTAAVAVWVAFLHFCYETPRLQQRIVTMQELARELVIEDERQIAAVVLRPTWAHESRWDVYLPDGEYAVRVATRDIREEGLTIAAKESLIDAGRHQIELIQSEGDGGRRITILVDDQKVSEIEESTDWNPGHGSRGSDTFEWGKQLAPHEPLILYRQRFMQRAANQLNYMPDHPTEGVMLWIERVSH